MTGKFLVVGTGRSGTTYCQAVLRVCGVNCTHQTVFTLTSYHSKQWEWGESAGEASFMAVPLLEQVREHEPDTRVILVRRGQEKAARSWLERGLFQGDMDVEYPDLHRVLTDMFPDVLTQPTPHERALRYCQMWTDHASRYADVTFDLETMDLPSFFAATGHGPDFDATLAGSISTTINTGRPR